MRLLVGVGRVLEGIHQLVEVCGLVAELVGVQQKVQRVLGLDRLAHALVAGAGGLRRVAGFRDDHLLARIHLVGHRHVGAEHGVGGRAAAVVDMRVAVIGIGRVVAIGREAAGIRGRDAEVDDRHVLQRGAGAHIVGDQLLHRPGAGDAAHAVQRGLPVVDLVRPLQAAQIGRELLYQGELVGVGVALNAHHHVELDAVLAQVGQAVELQRGIARGVAHVADAQVLERGQHLIDVVVGRVIELGVDVDTKGVDEIPDAGSRRAGHLCNLWLY